MSLSCLKLRLDPDPEKSSAGGGNPPAVPDPTDANAVMEGFRKRLEESDKSHAKLSQNLYGENVGLWRRLKDAEAKAKEQEATLAKYQGLGEPDALAKLQQERDTFAGELTGLKRAESIRSAASVAGVDADVIAPFLPADATFEIQDVKGKDGKPSKAALIKVGEGEAKPLIEWFQATHPKAAERLLGEGPSATSQHVTPRGGSPSGPRASREMPPPGAGNDRQAETNGIARDLVKNVGAMTF